MLIELEGNYDGLSFHCYEHYYESGLGNDCLRKYNLATRLTPKKVYISETAVLCKYKEDCQEAQLQHFNKLLTNLDTAWFWYMYHYNGWPTCPNINVDMIQKDCNTNSKSLTKVWYAYISQYH